MVWIQLQVTLFRVLQPSETNFQGLSSDLHPRDRRPGRRPRGLPLPHPADVQGGDSIDNLGTKLGTIYRVTAINVTRKGRIGRAE